MFKLSVQNNSGSTLLLTQNNGYSVIGITGLTPVQANINTSTAGINDGVLYNSSRLGYRNIVLTIALTNDVEAKRIQLYNYFQTKNACTLFFENDSRRVKISGYVEKFDTDLFSTLETLQISIICPKPHFNAVNDTVDTGISVSTVNNGDIAAGMTIELNCTGAVTNPTIRNTTTGEHFALTRDFISGDKITINTRTGEKSVILTRSGVKTNIINAFTNGSKWISLTCGNNAMTLEADSGIGNITAKFTHTDLFVGV